jgi:hypothetical protein
LLSQESHCILIFAIFLLWDLDPSHFLCLLLPNTAPPGGNKTLLLSQPANTRPSQKPNQNKTKQSQKKNFKKKTETKQCKNKTRRRCSQAFLARQRFFLKKRKGNKRVQTWSKKRKQKPRTRRRRQKQPTKGETAQKLNKKERKRPQKEKKNLKICAIFELL